MDLLYYALCLSGIAFCLYHIMSTKIQDEHYAIEQYMHGDQVHSEYQSHQEKP